MSKLVLEVQALVSMLRSKTSKLLFCLLMVFATTLLSGQVVLVPDKSPFRLPVPPRVLDLLPGAQGRIACESHIDTDFTSSRWVGSPGDVIAREEYIPLPGLALHGAGFRLAFEWAVKLDTDLSDFTETKLLRSYKFEPSVLRPSHAVVTIFAPEPRMSRCAPTHYPAKEAFERAIEPMECLLKHLTVDLCNFGSILLDLRKLLALFVVVDRRAFLPGFATLFKSGIIKFTTEFKLSLKRLDLRLGGIDPILEGSFESRYNRISHTRIIHARGQEPQPATTGGGFDYFAPKQY